MDKFLNENDADIFLRKLGFRISKDIIAIVLNALRDHDSLYNLYASGMRRDGSHRMPICGKGTVDKIKLLYDTGKLDSFITYIDSKSRAVISKDYGNLHTIRQETPIQTGQTAPVEELPEIKPPVIDQFSQEKIGKERIDIADSQGKYSEEWEHFNKIKEAIIKLQHVSEEQIGELLDLITRERVTLDDSGLQEYLDEFIEAIHETVDLGMDIPHSMITPIISRTSRRMNKRYKRN